MFNEYKSYNEMTKKELLVNIATKLDLMNEILTNSYSLPPKWLGMEDTGFVTSISGPVKNVQGCGGKCGGNCQCGG